MRSRSLFLLILFAAPLWLGANCSLAGGATYEDRPYSDQGAEGQTEDEQMEEVDEQINR